MGKHLLKWSSLIKLFHGCVIAPEKVKRRDRPFFCSAIEGAPNVRAISGGDLKVSSIITHKI